MEMNGDERESFFFSRLSCQCFDYSHAALLESFVLGHVPVRSWQWAVFSGRVEAAHC